MANHHLKLQYNSLKCNTAPNSVGKQKGLPLPASPVPCVGEYGLSHASPRWAILLRPDVLVEDWIISCPNLAGLSGVLKHGGLDHQAKLYYIADIIMVLGRSKFYNNYERKILKFGCG
jgi:hypothetical protein